jgi:uncharacterized protein
METIKENNLSNEDKLAIAVSFLTAMQKKDWDAMHSVLMPEATWDIPGNNVLSGNAVGVDGVITKAKLITSFSLNIQLNHILYGTDNVAISLHNQGNRDGKILNEYLVSVCILKGNKISSISSYMSDIPMMDAFFGKASENNK